MEYAMTAIFLFYVNNVLSYQAHFGEIKKTALFSHKESILLVLLK
jgi:hypothetical protein